MAAGCPGSCLFQLLVGSGGGGGIAGPAPPPAPKGTACERESWLEDELLRLQLEAMRLQDLNGALRDEIFWRESEPNRTKSKISDLFDKLPRVEISSDEDEPAQGPCAAATSTGSRRRSSLNNTAENIQDDVDRLGVPQRENSGGGLSLMHSTMAGYANTFVMKGSALSMTKPAQAVIYGIAFGFAAFVLIAMATHLGAVHHDEGSASGSSSAVGEHVAEHGRRLGGDVSPLMKNIAVTLTGAGMTTIVVNMLGLPLILGYLLGGVLVGPIGLGIVEHHSDIGEMSSLGLIFLLFMIGLELDMKALFKMGKMTVITGFLQFPICALITTLIFVAFEQAGMHLGGGDYPAVYCGVTAALSSTMIVVKLLGQKSELDTIAGRLSMGVLLCQDIWAVVVLALQTNVTGSSPMGVIKTFAMIGILIVSSLFYAKFVMPAVLFYASKSVELMLVLSLAWCFFICSGAILPIVGLPMEIAALVAGTALGTFPYSSDFNSKIKYIRDFFFVLFFAGMGMMLPVPKFIDVVFGILIALVLVLARWVGVFLPAWALGGDARPAGVATINLSQLGEFALVICTLGVAHGHVDEETLEIMIFVFAILSIASALMIKYNHMLYTRVSRVVEKTLGRPAAVSHGDSEEDEDREIVLLGFHKIAFMLIAEFKAKTPELLRSFHVIDFNKNIMPKLSELGLKCTCGDISSPEVLRKSQHETPRIVISTIPDSLLQGITNKGLVQTARQVWPDAHVIVTADNPQQAAELYEAGADYVLRMAKLSAERLHELLNEHGQHAFENSSLGDIFEHYKARDNNLRGATMFLSDNLKM